MLTLLQRTAEVLNIFLIYSEETVHTAHITNTYS